MNMADGRMKSACKSLLNGPREGCRSQLTAILIFIALCLITGGATAADVNGWALSVTANPSDPIMSFASDELQHWVGAVQAPQPGTPLAFTLEVDPTLKPFTFAVASAPSGMGRSVTLSGASSAEVLQAAYTALELMGYRFFISGPIVPASLDLTNLPTAQKIYVPTVQRRGIRQHINFPMDVSGYPLEEAKEYVRNLARQRYNWITFHSYPGQWTWDYYGNAWVNWVYRELLSSHLDPDPAWTSLSNGAFFYGEHFPIPNCSLIKDRIRFNQAIYCMPGVEPDYYTVKERGETMAVWLGEVMKECKRVGLKVQFSTEIRLCDDAFNLGLVDRIYRDYPVIDALEFITREGGTAVTGNFDTYYAAQKVIMDEILNAADGKAIDTKYPWWNLPAGIDVQAHDLALNLRLAKLLTQNGWVAKNKVQLVVGNYTTDPSSVRLVCKMAAEYLPAEMWYSLMPGYSSRVVADYLGQSQIGKALLARMFLYSWVEFDGYMFMQQFAGSGVYNAITNEQAILGDQPVFGILYNHWRSGENFMSFRYAALASLEEKPTVDAFLGDYAQRAGIKDVAKFTSAMKEIDAQSDGRTLPGNIGFCIKGTWLINPQNRDVAQIWWWGKTEINAAASRYQRVAQNLQSCLGDVTDPQIRQQLELLVNRCQASYCHLKSVRLMQDALIRFNYTTYKMPSDLTETEKATIVRLCGEAGDYVRQYVRLTGQFMVDRGVEGFLINYYYGPPMLVHNFRAAYGGQGLFLDAEFGSEGVPFELEGVDLKTGVPDEATCYE